jgi:hypothetical protein
MVSLWGQPMINKNGQPKYQQTSYLAYKLKTLLSYFGQSIIKPLKMHKKRQDHLGQPCEDLR